MAYLNFLAAMAVVVMMQCVLVSTCPRRRGSRSSSSSSSSTCSYPEQHQSNHDTSSDYFLGTTPLKGGKFGKGKRDVISPFTFKHSMILFRGKIFEWGINKDYKMDRNPRSCKISWTWGKKGYSRCLVSDAESWTRSYESKYGSYNFLGNNCHMFSNRLADYLWSDCGR